MMIILLTVIAIVITGAPLSAIVLVTLASRREETARSIAGLAPGSLARAARRLLAFHAVGIGQPASRAGAGDQTRSAADPALDDPVPADEGLALAGTWPR
jgi:hypothetical protein